MNKTKLYPVFIALTLALEELEAKLIIR